MASASACVECHTQVKQGQILPEVAFGGGREFAFPDGSVVRSPNITPDKHTGIGNWTREQFVARFKVFTDSSYVTPSVKPGEFNSIMPWTMYGQMTEADLSAIFAYLQSVPPISNQVVKHTARVR